MQVPTVHLVVPTLGQRLDMLDLALGSITDQRDISIDLTVVAKQLSPALQTQCIRHGARLLEQSGSGMSQAINQGWSHSQRDSTYWAWLGDDDLLAPGALAAATQYLEDSRGTVMVFGRCLYIDEVGHPLWEARPTSAAVRLLRRGPDLVPQPGSVARASAIRQVGLLDEGLRFAMDLDLFIRLRSAGRIDYLPRRLASFRWHTGSTTVSSLDQSIAEAAEVRRRHRRGPDGLSDRSLDYLAMLAGRALHRAQKFPARYLRPATDR